MTDHSQLVKRLREWGETPYEGDPIIDALLSDVPAAADAIDTLQARVEALEAGKRAMHRRAQRAEGAIFRCREWMRLRDEHLAQDRSEFVRQGMANFYMIQMAKPIRRFLERKA